MQHLGAEVRKLRRLFKADRLDPQRLRHNARIGRHNAIHIGPDFNGPARRAPPASAAEKSLPPRPSVVVMPSTVAPMNPPITGTRAASSRGSACSSGASESRFQWRRLAEFRVRHDARACIQMRARKTPPRSAAVTIRLDQPLTEAHHQVRRARRQLTHGGNAAQQVVQRVELCVQVRSRSCRPVAAPAESPPFPRAASAAAR